MVMIELGNLEVASLIEDWLEGEGARSVTRKTRTPVARRAATRMWWPCLNR